MEQPAPAPGEATPLDPGLRALGGVAAYYRIGADPGQMRRDLALTDRLADEHDLIRGANLIGLKARLVTGADERRMASASHSGDRAAAAAARSTCSAGADRRASAG